MEGYSITEAASVLGVPTERVWELLARGVLSGAPEGETGMRVFLQPRPAPRAAIEEPRADNGNATPRQQDVELSPFRELLTEFRNLTERYGQALLALGEARGEVASLRSRVDLLEARFDLRLPMSGPAPQPGSEWRPRAVVEPVTEGVGESRSAGAAEHDAEEPPRRKRSRGQRRATDEFAEALARAEDPTPAELPGAADAAAALAALRDETERGGEPEADVEASLPRDLPAAEPIATLEPEPIGTLGPEPVIAEEPEPVATLEPEPVIAEEPEPVIAEEPEPVATPEPEPIATLEPEPIVTPEPEPVVAEEPEPVVAEEPAEVPGADVAPPVATVSEPVAAIEPQVAPDAEEESTTAAFTEPTSPGDVEPTADLGDEALTAEDMEAAAGTVVRFETAIESEAAWDVPSDAEGERDEEWAVPSGGEPTSDAEPVDEASPSWSTGIADDAEGAPTSDVDATGTPPDVAAADVQPAVADEWNQDEPSWDRHRYTTEIEEPDWIPEGPPPAVGSGQPAADVQPDPTRSATSDRIESEAFGWGQEETERWFASGQDVPSAADEPIGDEEAAQEVEAPSEEAIEPAAPPPIEDPAEEMEVAGASGYARPAVPVWDVDQEPVEPAAATPWAPAPSPPPAWAERLPTPGSSPTPTVETGPASRAYRRLRRIFPG